MHSFDCYAIIQGTKYIGRVEAETKGEAEEKALVLADAVSFCPACSPFENPEVKNIIVEREVL